MDRAGAYLISVGIVGFGLWVLTAGIVSPGPFPIWVFGLLPVLVGLASLYNQIQDDRHR
jgi:hypothetical protein